MRLTADDVRLLTEEADDKLFRALTVEERAEALDAARYAERARREFCKQQIRDAADILGGQIIWGRRAA